jgi:hypothetical protein
VTRRPTLARIKGALRRAFRRCPTPPKALSLPPDPLCRSGVWRELTADELRELPARRVEREDDPLMSPREKLGRLP